jgi:hypothetical protein
VRAQAVAPGNFSVEFDYRLKVVAVIILFPIIGNIFQVFATDQFIIQDYILQMKNVGQTDYEIVSKYYESVLEREGHYQEYHYFAKQVYGNHAD